MHDHETALYHFGRDHGECNVHIIRYLRKNTDDTGNSWSGRMSSLLCGMNRERKELIGQEIHAFPVEEVTAFEKSYQELITRGREENKKTRHRYAQKEEKTLLNRMEKYRHNHLLFLHDFAVPFDDNMSERDLRKGRTVKRWLAGFEKKAGMRCIVPF